MCVLAVVLIVSSVAHWRAPRWRGFARSMDIACVSACVGYGSATARAVDRTLARGWWIGVSIAMCAWVMNHATYARARAKWARAKDSVAEEEKTRVWRRLALTHMVGVHLMSSVSATWLAFGL